MLKDTIATLEAREAAVTVTPRHSINPNVPSCNFATEPAKGTQCPACRHVEAPARDTMVCAGCGQLDPYVFVVWVEQPRNGRVGEKD